MRANHKTPDIVLIGGMPGSEKTGMARQLKESPGIESSVEYLSVTEEIKNYLKRSAENDRNDEDLLSREIGLRAMSALDDNTTETKVGILLLSGYPQCEKEVKEFLEALHYSDAHLLGEIVATIPPGDDAIERIIRQSGRSISPDDAQWRIRHYHHITQRAREKLQQELGFTQINVETGKSRELTAQLARAALSKLTRNKPQHTVGAYY